MDDLEFRRQIYASPKQHSSEVKQAMLADPSKRQFAEDMHKFEDKLNQAYQIDVPADLASKIILKQTLDQHKQKDKKRNLWYIATAASIAFIFGLTFNQLGFNPLQPNDKTELATLMVEHAQRDMIHHFVSPQSIQNTSVNLASINQKLSSFGAQLDQNFAIVRSVNFCQMKNVRALHLIVQGEHGLVNIFIMHPIKSLDNLPQIKDELFTGLGHRYPKADLMYIGNKAEKLDQIQQKFEQQLKWQI